MSGSTQTTTAVVAALAATTAAVVLLSRWSNRHRQRRPQRVVLVRHGESEANKDPTVFSQMPDSHIHITKLGWRQAERAGCILRGQVRGKVRTVVSPYVRTRETLLGLAKGFGDPALATLAHEDYRLCEVDCSGGNLFGEELWQERDKLCSKDPFFYRFPNGESLADLQLRVDQFWHGLVHNGSFDAMGADTVVVVSHAVTIMALLKAILPGASPDTVATSSCVGNGELILLERSTDSSPWVGPERCDYRVVSRVAPKPSEDDACNPHEVEVERRCRADADCKSQWELFFKPDSRESGRQRLSELVRSDASLAEG